MRFFSAARMSRNKFLVWKKGVVAALPITNPEFLRLKRASSNEEVKKLLCEYATERDRCAYAYSNRNARPLPKYSMVFTFRIFRTDDTSVVAEGMKAFRSDSIQDLVEQFKSRVAQEEVPNING